MGSEMGDIQKQFCICSCGKEIDERMPVLLADGVQHLRKEGLMVQEEPDPKDWVGWQECSFSSGCTVQWERSCTALPKWESFVPDHTSHKKQCLSVPLCIPPLWYCHSLRTTDSPMIWSTKTFKAKWTAVISKIEFLLCPCSCCG